MNSEWQKFITLDGHGAKDSSDQTPVVDAAAVVCPLVSESVVHVTGEDAEKFLQAQFSNDIAALQTPGSQLTTWSSPKGRVITLLRVLKVSDGFLLRLPTDLLETILKRLRMYVLMSKVVLEPRNDLLVAGVSVENALPALNEMTTALPQVIDASVELSGGGWLTRVRSGSDSQAARFEIVASTSQVGKYWSVLSQSCPIGTEASWRLQNIDAGIPSINAATTEAFVLQMLNLQHINGVSFKKGCFPGQEVVARMQYLGKLKRQMYRLQSSGEATPAAGDDIYVAGRDSSVGKVVDAVGVDKQQSRLLAVLAIAETTEPLFLDKAATRPLELIDLPYDTPVADCS